MKLAEALILRADYQRRIEELRSRILRNVKVQEGDMPAENPNKLLEEVRSVSQHLVRIIQSINKTNSATQIEDGMTITDALALRDILALNHKLYRDIAQQGTVQERYTRSEIKFKSTMNVEEIQKVADDFAKKYRELDAKIQEINWLTELLD